MTTFVKLTRAALICATAILAAPVPAAGDPPGEQRTASLDEAFRDPPASPRPRVWWHWMSGNISKDGIAKDLAWTKRVGIAAHRISMPPWRRPRSSTNASFTCRGNDGTPFASPRPRRIALASSLRSPRRRASPKRTAPGSSPRTAQRSWSGAKPNSQRARPSRQGSRHRPRLRAPSSPSQPIPVAVWDL